MDGMKKKDLKQIGRGFYADEDKRVYLDMNELLAAHNLPDSLEVRQAILQQVKDEFGVTEVTELSD
jgi:hypothetical protein